MNRYASMCGNRKETSITEQAKPAEARVQVLRSSDRAGWGRFFSSEIAGNRVAKASIVNLGTEQLHMLLAETDGGATFPAQYHTGGVELAVIIAGVGAIEVVADEVIQEVFECEAGNVVLIPAQLVYRVRNRHASEPLVAWVLCGEDTQFYWPDGSKA